MNKASFLPALLLLACSVCSVAQNNKHTPYLQFGKCPAAIFTSGKWIIQNTTCAEMLSDPELKCELPGGGGKVVHYAVIIYPSGGDLQGPYFVKGSELTQPVKDLLKKNEGGKGIIEINNVMVTERDGQTRSMADIELKYTN